VAPAGGVLLPDGLGVVEPDGAGVAPAGACGWSCPTPSTVRNSSFAGRSSFSSSPFLLAFWPATLTTMSLLPTTRTSASVTPVEFTRWAMMLRATVMESEVGSLPVRVCAFSVALVPPTRSRPSFGDGLWFPNAKTNP